MQTAVRQTAAYLQVHGFSQVDAMRAAYGRYHEQLSAQTRLLGFMDCFYIIGVLTLVASPLALFSKSFKVAGKGTAAH